MTTLARLWPDPYTVAVLRRFCPGTLAELAAWILALAARLTGALMPSAAVLDVRYLTVLVAIPPLRVVAWSAPDGADLMRTGPPRLVRETPRGAGRT